MSENNLNPICVVCSQPLAADELGRNGICAKCWGSLEITICATTGRTHYGRYWTTNTPASGNTAEPSYTGLGGAQFTMHPAAHFPNAFGAGTRNLPIENAGIRAGEIIAFRCWILTRESIVDETYHMRSTYAKCVWRPGETVGLSEEYRPDSYIIYDSIYRQRYLKIDPHDRYGVRVGVHGFKSSAKMMREFRPFGLYDDSHFIYGTAALWGEVIEHEEGFRAEFGKVNTIDQIDTGMGHDGLLDKLKKVYGVEGKSCLDFKIGV